MDERTDGAAPRRRRRKQRSAWLRITPEELTCRVADEGVLSVAERLVIAPATVRAAMTGAFRLSAIRVLALRDGVDLRPVFAAFGRARRMEHADV